MQLAYCVRSLARPQDEAASLLSRLGLAAEIGDDGAVDEPLWRRAGVPVVTVQAWWLHEAHPLHPDALLRERARRRFVDSLDLAVRLGARRALAVCGFGQTVADRPFERSLDFFAALARPLAERGLTLLLEPLSPLRCAAMWRVTDLLRLLDALDAPDLFRLCLDTGHLTDSGCDPGREFAGVGRPVDEIQLKGPVSAPPPADAPLAQWVASLPAPPRVICLEHNQPLPEGGVERLIAALRASLAFDTSGATPAAEEPPCV